MKDKLFISLILVVLALVVGGLFWYGERVIYLKANTGYSVLSFKSADDSISIEKEDFDTLTFSIRGFESEIKEYNIKILVDDIEIDSLSKKIGREIIVFEPTKKVKKQLMSSDIKSLFKYTVIAHWDGKEEFITKKVQIDEE